MIEISLPNACIFSVFHNPSYQNHKLHAKLALCGKKMTLPEKCLLSVFERDLQQSTKKQNNHITWE